MADMVATFRFLEMPDRRMGGIHHPLVSSQDRNFWFGTGSCILTLSRGTWIPDDLGDVSNLPKDFLPLYSHHRNHRPDYCLILAGEFSGNPPLGNPPSCLSFCLVFVPGLDLIEELLGRVAMFFVTP